VRVMIADQDPAHRRFLADRLQQLGHSTEEASTPREVVEQCRKKCPDLIFIDAILSGMVGVEIVNQVRQTGGHALWVPIVLMGSAWSPEDMNKGIEVGVDDILPKPLSDEKLRLRVKSAERLLSLKEEVFKVAHDLVLENRSLQNVITRDPLTGLNNSNSFDKALETAWKTAQNDRKPLSLIFLNLDFFQAYNQTYGAAFGDEAMKKVADTFKALVPAHGFLARAIGETFTVLLACDQAEAFAFAEQLRAAVEALKIPHQQSGCADHLTLSFGVATLSEKHAYTTPSDLKDAADFALYQAKHQGRNRGVFSQ
jgi:diguanylate cyclase (GGDEF)-like protein